MKVSILTILMLALPLPEPAVAGELSVRITGLPAEAGVARIVLMQGPEGYAGDRPVALTAQVPARDGEAHWTTGVPKGTYALIAHHDRDGNDDLNRPYLQLPLERYGYSNGAWTSFGLPEFDAVAFDVGDGSTHQHVHLRTNAFVTLIQIAAVAVPLLALLLGGLTLRRRLAVQST